MTEAGVALDDDTRSRIAEWADQVAADAPPLSEAQLDRISLVLNGTES